MRMTAAPRSTPAASPPPPIATPSPPAPAPPRLTRLAVARVVLFSKSAQAQLARAPHRRELAGLHRRWRRWRKPRGLVLPHVLPLGHLARVLADRLRHLGGLVLLGHFLVDHAAAIDVAATADRGIDLAEIQPQMAC